MANLQIHNLIYKLSKFWLFITFLQSLYAWFTWGQISKSIILVIAFLHCILFVIISPKFFQQKQANIVPLMIFAIAELYVMKTFGILSIIRSIIQIFIVAFILFLKNEHKIDLLNYFTKGMALILAISLFLWILYLFGIPLPHYVIKHPDFIYWYDNYYLFLADNKGIIPRFCSIFLEPGQLGIITAFLLYANKFNFRRKEVLVLFIATLFTLSLAAYILTFISAVTIIFFNSSGKMRFGVFSKRKIVIGLLFLAAISAGVIFFNHYRSGDNIIKRMILSRLEIKNGKLSRNNRFSPDFDVYFDSFNKTNDVILGIGNDFLKMKWQFGNAGWKVFLVQYGIIGIFLVFLLYSSIVLYNFSGITIMFMVIYALCFLQAAYPLWLCELFIFITSMPFLNKYQKPTIYDVSESAD